MSFRWRDYADKNKTKVMTLDAKEFMRRYLQHVLPAGFTRIRQIGFLSNRYKSDKLTQCRTALNFNAEPIVEESTDELLLRVCHINIYRCSYCHSGNKKTLLTLSNNYNQYHQSRGIDTS